MPTTGTLVHLGRTAHLIDIENLCGGGHLTVAQVQSAHAVYYAAVSVADTDHVVVSSSHHNALAVALGWPHARYCWRSGPDGADLALQEVMVSENLDRRFVGVVLATGDGGFDFSVAQLISRGCPVEVVAPTGACARRLQLAATRQRSIDFAEAVTIWGTA